MFRILYQHKNLPGYWRVGRDFAKFVQKIFFLFPNFRLVFLILLFLKLRKAFKNLCQTFCLLLLLRRYTKIKTLQKTHSATIVKTTVKSFGYFWLTQKYT